MINVNSLVEKRIESLHKELMEDRLARGEVKKRLLRKL